MIKHSPAGATWKIFVDKNSNISMIGPNGGRSYDRGLYAIDERFVVYHVAKDPRRAEDMPVRISERRHVPCVQFDSSLNATYEVRPGNPENL